MDAIAVPEPMRSVCGHSAAAVPVMIRLRRLIKLVMFIPMIRVRLSAPSLKLIAAVPMAEFYLVLPVPVHRFRLLNTATALILRPALSGGYQPISRWLQYVRRIFPGILEVLLIGQELVIVVKRIIWVLVVVTLAILLILHPKVTILTSVRRRSKSVEPKPSQ